MRHTHTHTHAVTPPLKQNTRHDTHAQEPLPAAFVDAQKAVDAALTAALDADVKGYLSRTFTLKAGDRPHLLKF